MFTGHFPFIMANSLLLTTSTLLFVSGLWFPEADYMHSDRVMNRAHGDLFSEIGRAHV